MTILRVFIVACVLCAGCASSTKKPDAGDVDAGGSGGSAGTGGSGGTSGTGGDCVACHEGRDCCDGACVNLANDPRHCGACSNACTASASLCSHGVCIEPPCTTTCVDAACCGNICCGANQLCCDIEGPVGGIIGCVDAVDGTCPQGCAPLCVCNSPDTPIATAEGDRPIAELRVGDLVYSVDRGSLTLVPIARVQRVPVVKHAVMRVVLSSGVILEISARHPLVDGRHFGDLRVGDLLDHATVIHSELVPYAHDFTYDILPASDTGHYVAGGVLIASTM